MPASAARSAWPGDSNEGRWSPPQKSTTNRSNPISRVKIDYETKCSTKIWHLESFESFEFQATTNCSQYQYFSISHSFYNQFTNNQTEIAFQFLRIICKSASAVCTSMIQFIAIKMVALRKSQYILIRTEYDLRTMRVLNSSRKCRHEVTAQSYRTLFDINMQMLHLLSPPRHLSSRPRHIKYRNNANESSTKCRKAYNRNCFYCYFRLLLMSPRVFLH